MAAKDPFDDVLKAVCSSEHVQNSLPAVIEMHNTAQQVSCRVQVMDTAGRAADIQHVPSVVRERWALKLIKFIHPTPAAASHTRPMKISLILDGTVRIESALSEESTNVYPARYRIPPSTISDLPLHEQVWRAEKFALGILLYEIFTGHKPFEELDDDEVQDQYSNADFPQDLGSVEPLDLQSLIYACWSAEFGRYITLSRFQQYVRENPWWFTLQVTSGVVGVAALVTVPILGAVGFGAFGPVVGSAAAAWQASIGDVKPGSLFAICQSAAMGGTAATCLAITGPTGLAIVTGVGAAAIATSGAQKLRGVFIQKFRMAA